MKDIIPFVKSLPQGSTLDFQDSGYKRLEVYSCAIDERRDGTKGVTLLLEEEDKSPKNYTYNLKHLDGIQTLALCWDRYKEDLFAYCCISQDDRWKDPDFRNHMYDKYFNTDRPITDQLFNLDQYNVRTLMRYIDEELSRHTNSSREVTF